MVPVNKAAGHTGGQALTLPTALRIAAIYTENVRTKTFVLDAKLDAYPGQFVMAWLPRFDEKPFSLVACDPVTLMVSAVGPFSRLLHERNVGDPLWIRGPFGHGFVARPEERRIVVVGGGYGVAPLYWLVQTWLGRTEQIDVLLGARTAGDLLYADRFARLAAAERFPVSPSGAGASARCALHVTTEDGSAGRLGLVTAAIEPLLAAGHIDGIYACGPHGMLSTLAALGRRFAVPCQLSWEAYMRCAVGICGACEHEGRVLCLDGPVLAVG